ncbi:MAG: hypothetical protein ACTHW7_12410 [Actinomycetaceae bacterium]
MDYVTKPDMEAVLRREVTEAEWGQIQALLRRAERELTLLVGDLSQHDPELVADTLADAIREEWVNPERYKSEQDNSYSYTRATLPSGHEGRFWWPENLLELFGIGKDHRGRLKVVPIGISPGMRGWIS